MRLCLSLFALFWTISLPSALRGQGAQEPPAPQPTSPAVITALREEAQLAAGKQYAAALQAAERAITIAYREQDVAGEAQADCERAKLLSQADRTTEAIRAWRAAALAWRRVKAGPERIEAMAQAGLLQAQTDIKAAERLYAEAIEQERAEGLRPLAGAEALNEAGRCALGRSYPALARRCCEAARIVIQRLKPNSLPLSDALYNLGEIARLEGDFRAAEPCHLEAERIRQSLPGRPGYAQSCLAVARMYNQRGDLGLGILAYFQKWEKQCPSASPDSLAYADSQAYLGLFQGPTRYDAVERSLAIYRRLSRDTAAEVVSLHLLRVAAMGEGPAGAAIAQDYCRRELEVVGRVARDPDQATDLADVLAMLYEAYPGPTTPYLDRALTVWTERNQRSYGFALLLMCKAEYCLSVVDFARAGVVYCAPAQEILYQVAPDSWPMVMAALYLAAWHLNHGGIPEQQLLSLYFGDQTTINKDDLEKADRQIRRARILGDQLSPGHQEMIRVHLGQGWVDYLEGRFDAADDEMRRAIEIAKINGWDTDGLGYLLLDRAVVARKRKRWQKAALYRHEGITQLNRNDSPHHFDDVVSDLFFGEKDKQRLTEEKEEQNALLRWQWSQVNAQGLRDDKARLHYNRLLAAAATELMRVQLAHKKPEAAFETLEESRATGLRQAIIEQYRFFQAASTDEHKAYEAALAQLNARKRQFDKSRVAEAKLQACLAAARSSHRPPGDIERLNRELDQAVRECDRADEGVILAQEEVDRYLRQAIPELPELPRLSLSQLQAALDSDVLLLSYSVDDARTSLFVVTRTSFRVCPIPVQGAALEKQVQDYRKWISSRSSSTTLYQPPALALYDLLLRPAQKEVETAGRIMLCPDGPLHLLPFASLMPDRSHFFVETGKPLCVNTSLSTYLMLHSRLQAHGADGDPPPQSLVALFAPGPPPAAMSATLGSPVALSHTHVQEIARLYPGKSVLLLDQQATRSRLLAASGQARWLHLTSHGYADDRDPLNSWLALSPENSHDDGLLRAWEVMQKLHLRADLVTLAACQTGLGPEVGHEGIVGLARAFEYAGAHSVLMSLWRVDEEKTNTLMIGFYRHLQQGANKDEALREAQLEVLAQDRRPYFWAAFELSGDWK